MHTQTKRTPQSSKQSLQIAWQIASTKLFHTRPSTITKDPREIRSCIKCGAPSSQEFSKIIGESIACRKTLQAPRYRHLAHAEHRVEETKFGKVAKMHCPTFGLLPWPKQESEDSVAHFLNLADVCLVSPVALPRRRWLHGAERCINKGRKQIGAFCFPK